MNNREFRAAALAAYKGLLAAEEQKKEDAKRTLCGEFKERFGIIPDEARLEPMRVRLTLNGLDYFFAAYGRNWTYSPTDFTSYYDIGKGVHISSLATIGRIIEERENAKVRH